MFLLKNICLNLLHHWLAKKTSTSLFLSVHLPIAPKNPQAYKIQHNLHPSTAADHAHLCLITVQTSREGTTVITLEKAEATGLSSKPTQEQTHHIFICKQ
jgi:hypothetical protein